MSLELSPHEFDNVVVIAPAEGGAVQWNERLSGGDIIEHGFGLSVFDAVDVGVEDQTVELVEHFRGEVFHAVGVFEFDAALFEDTGEFVKAFRGAMMTVVAHEQQFQVGGRRERRGGVKEGGNQGQTSAERGGDWHLEHVDKPVGRLRGSRIRPILL